MARSEAQKKAEANYEKSRTGEPRINMRVTKTEKEQIKTLANSKGMTMKELVFYLINKEVNVS